MSKKKPKLKRKFKIRPKKGGKVDLKKRVKIGIFQCKFKKGDFLALFFLI